MGARRKALQVGSGNYFSFCRKVNTVSHFEVPSTSPTVVQQVLPTVSSFQNIQPLQNINIKNPVKEQKAINDGVKQKINAVFQNVNYVHKANVHFLEYLLRLFKVGYSYKDSTSLVIKSNIDQNLLVDMLNKKCKEISDLEIDVKEDTVKGNVYNLCFKTYIMENNPVFLIGVPQKTIVLQTGEKILKAYDIDPVSSTSSVSNSLQASHLLDEKVLQIWEKASKLFAEYISHSSEDPSPNEDNVDGIGDTFWILMYIEFGSSTLNISLLQTFLTNRKDFLFRSVYAHTAKSFGLNMLRIHQGWCKFLKGPTSQQEQYFEYYLNKQNNANMTDDELMNMRLINMRNIETQRDELMAQFKILGDKGFTLWSGGNIIYDRHGNCVLQRDTNHHLLTFMSTSLDFDTAQMFLKRGMDCLYEFHLPVEMIKCVMPLFALGPNEKEILLPIGTHFTVTNFEFIEGQNPYWHVQATIVGFNLNFNERLVNLLESVNKSIIPTQSSTQMFKQKKNRVKRKVGGVNPDKPVSVHSFKALMKLENLHANVNKQTLFLHSCLLSTNVSDDDVEEEFNEILQELSEIAPEEIKSNAQDQVVQNVSRLSNVQVIDYGDLLLSRLMSKKIISSKYKTLEPFSKENLLDKILEYPMPFIRYAIPNEDPEKSYEDPDIGYIDIRDYIGIDEETGAKFIHKNPVNAYKFTSQKEYLLKQTQLARITKRTLSLSEIDNVMKRFYSNDISEKERFLKLKKVHWYLFGLWLSGCMTSQDVKNIKKRYLYN